MPKTALLVIDLQNDYFPGGKWELMGVEQAAANAAALMAACRGNGVALVHVRHEFPTVDAPFFLPGSEGAAIHASVAPADGEPVVTKHQINSFRDTDLHETLKKMGVEGLRICGAMSHMCVDAATRAAVDLGYNCAVAHDACATRDLDFGDSTVPASQVHAAFMSALEFGYGRLASTEELVGEIAR